MNRQTAVVIGVLVLCGLSSAQIARGEAAGAAIGASVGKLEFKDIWYLPRSLDDLGDKQAFAIVFTSTTCPITTAYLPELKRLDEEYCERGVQFVAVNVAQQDSVRDIAAQNLEHEIKFPFVKDFNHSCVAALGVTHTPQVVVLDGQRRIRYRGRIDDRYVDASAEREPKQRDLIAALDAVLAGKDVTQPETPAVGTPIAAPKAPDVPGEVTFAEHVAPILTKHCQSCHRPGTEAPFSLVTHDDAANHADMVAEVIAEERMPPWYASFGKFENAPTMTDEERDIVRAWVARGCPPGDLAKLTPPAPEVVEPAKWNIEEPDLVISVPQPHDLPADGYVAYKYVILPYRFAHDTWIQQCEIKPDNPRVVHHCNMAYLENALDWTSAKFVLGKVPGVMPMKLEQGLAFRIPKGSVLILQIHYTTTGQPEKCQISVGMRYAREVVNKELHYLWMVDEQFAIPPGDALHRVTATNVLNCDALSIGAFAHMHFRGRHMSFFAHYPDNRVEKLLVIPNFSFDWQLAYRWDQPKRFPKGTRIECVSHYDNSPFNPYNPDPKATVREGQQTFQEMLNGVMFYLDEGEQLNLKVDPATGKALSESASR